MSRVATPEASRDLLLDRLYRIRVDEGQSGWGLLKGLFLNIRGKHPPLHSHFIGEDHRQDQPPFTISVLSRKKGTV